MVPHSHDDKVQEFCDCMIENYILEDARFPSTVWAGLNEELFVKSTNASDSFYAHYKQEFHHAHPPIYTLFLCPKQRQCTLCVLSIRRSIIPTDY